MCIYLSVRMSVSLFVCLSVYPSVYLSVCWHHRVSSHLIILHHITSHHTTQSHLISSHLISAQLSSAQLSSAQLSSAQLSSARLIVQYNAMHAMRCEVYIRFSRSMRLWLPVYPSTRLSTRPIPATLLYPTLCDLPVWRRTPFPSPRSDARGAGPAQLRRPGSSRWPGCATQSAEGSVAAWGCLGDFWKWQGSVPVA